MNITRLIIGQLNSLGERGQSLIKHLQIRIRDAQMIVNISNISLEWLILKGSIQILNSLLKLFILIECQPPLIQDTGIIRLPVQCAS